jgi:poly-beta-1,6-N-acetyl-D-glucosamine synthase
MTEVLLEVARSPVYQILMLYLAGFPILVALLAINGSRQYLLDRSRVATEDDFPHLPELREAQSRWPVVSVLIPARNEEVGIGPTIQAALALSWPGLEVIVVNDGSTDSTAEEIAPFVSAGKISLITHEQPLGKSASLNEAMRLASSEVVLILDADARPAKNALNRMVPIFLDHDDIAAITGNPRVANTGTLLGKLQAIEFTSTISTLRRGQAAWGRVNTISGVMSVLRKDAVLSRGGFSLTQPTEDIELTWRLHKDGLRCVYEPAAQVAMEVPETLGQWWKQRTRWASGLVRVLQTHGLPMLRKWEWPVFPLLLEAVAAIFWCHLLVVATGFWIVTAAHGLPLLGNSPVLSHWGTLTVLISILQIYWGMHLDSSHDKGIWKLWVFAPMYPIAYWWLSSFVVVVSTIPTLLTKSKHVDWSLDRPKM